MSAKNLLCIAFFFIITSCSSESEYNQEDLAEAYTIQKEILTVLTEIQDILNSENVTWLDSLEDIMHGIEENLFEIPGYTLELPGHQGHDHSHERVELTSAEMVTVNRELLKQANKIKVSLENE